MSIAENLESVLETIDKCAGGRSVKLVAVSKTVDADRVNEAISAGAGCIGENRVQELLEKEPRLLPVEKHLIGTLQLNKVKKIVGHAALIHSVDSAALADEINRISAKQGVVTDVLAQVNIGLEETKGGVRPEDAYALCRYIQALENVKLKGLMCVPPVCTGDEARRYFAQLRELRDRYNASCGGDMTELSMGMSGDYAEAVMEGATIVRVGSAIFGKRDYGVRP